MDLDKQLLVENDLLWAVKVLCDTQDYSINQVFFTTLFITLPIVPKNTYLH